MNASKIKALSAELKEQRRLKYNEYHKRYYHKRVKSKPFVSVLDMENPPPKRVYNRTKIDDETDDGFDDDTDDNASVMTDITNCSLIGTTYKKTPHLKRLDTQLREKLYEKGYDTQDKVANLFTTLRNVNSRYGLPILEQRIEPRIEQFYKDTIVNLG